MATLGGLVLPLKFSNVPKLRTLRYLAQPPFTSGPMETTIGRLRPQDPLVVPGVRNDDPGPYL
jgi:hypothetical protein